MTKDEAGHVWIRRDRCTAMVYRLLQELKRKVEPDQVYCMRCKQSRPIKPDTLEIVTFGRVRELQEDAVLSDA